LSHGPFGTGVDEGVTVGDDVTVGVTVPVAVGVDVGDGTTAGAQAVRIRTRKNSAAFFISYSSGAKWKTNADMVTVTWDLLYTK